MRGSPVAAVTELKKLNLTRVLNDYDFGGFLIANGVAPFIDGRTELYGEKFFVDHNAASGLMEPDNLFRLLAQYNIEATLMRTQSRCDKIARPCRRLAEDLFRRHRDDSSAQARARSHTVSAPAVVIAKCEMSALALQIALCTLLCQNKSGKIRVNCTAATNCGILHKVCRAND